jgi:hypothetical protein
MMLHILGFSMLALMAMAVIGLAVAAYAGIQAEREETTGEMIARASGLAQPFNRPDSWHPDRRGDNRP